MENEHAAKNKKITQAFLLGAGLGTRLRPLTEAMPKVMVPIADDKPLLEHTIELLRDQGIKDFLINLHYLPDVITSRFGDGSRLGVRIRYSDESGQLLETAGAIRKTKDILDDDFLLLYGDHLHFFDIAPLVYLYFKHNCLGVITLKTSEHPQDGDVAEFDPLTRRITKWHQRPHDIIELGPTRFVNAGIYAFSKRILDYIPIERPVKLDGEVIPAAMAAGEIFYAFPTEEPILDIGKPEKYERAKEYYRQEASKKKKPQS